MHPQHDKTVEQITTWCRSQPQVHSALALGSQVQDEHCADRWSDLDVLLLVDDPQTWMENDDWLSFLGAMAFSTSTEEPLPWTGSASAGLTWRVKRALLRDGRAIDFSIMPYDRVDDVLAINAEIHAQGYRVLYDRHGSLLRRKVRASLAAFEAAPPAPPSEAALWQAVEELLYELVWACKKLMRGELWVAVGHVNQAVSQRLLPLIEYHALASGADPGKLRYGGRLLEHRISDAVHERLEGCMADYSPMDALRAMGHTFDTALWLTRETCAALHYPFREETWQLADQLLIRVTDPEDQGPEAPLPNIPGLDDPFSRRGGRALRLVARLAWLDARAAIMRVLLTALLLAAFGLLAYAEGALWSRPGLFVLGLTALLWVLPVRTQRYPSFLLWISSRFVLGGLALYVTILAARSALPAALLIGLVVAALLLTWVSVVRAVVTNRKPRNP